MTPSRPPRIKLYADTPGLRLRQQLQDTATLVWVAAWGLAGRTLYRTVEQLRAATGGAEAAGGDFANRLDDVARRVTGVPLVGNALRHPFTGAADAGRTLEAAGATAGDTVHTLALWLGLLVALVPIAWLLARRLPRRYRWMREAGAATSFRIGADDLELFAIRAVATAPLHELRRAAPDPARALADGDFAPLAAIELARLGLRPPAVPA